MAQLLCTAEERSEIELRNFSEFSSSFPEALPSLLSHRNDPSLANLRLYVDIQSLCIPYFMSIHCCRSNTSSFSIGISDITSPCALLIAADIISLQAFAGFKVPG